MGTDLFHSRPTYIDWEENREIGATNTPTYPQKCQLIMNYCGK